jgi:hypothetical protein
MNIPCPKTSALLVKAFGPFLLLLFLLLQVTPSEAQTTTASDTVTPMATAPGAAEGSFELSGFESVNLYNGNLSFHLPLAHLGGRGAAGYTLTLSLNTKSWIVKHATTQSSETWIPTPNGWAPQPGFTAGIMRGRRSGFDVKFTGGCSELRAQIYDTTLTTLTFIAPDGTEYDFRDQLNGGARMAVTTSCPSFPYTGALRGKVWVTTDGSAATFISDNDIYDAVRYSDHAQDCARTYRIHDLTRRYALSHRKWRCEMDSRSQREYGYAQ